MKLAKNRLALATVTLLAAAAAEAHFKLVEPASWIEEDERVRRALCDEMPAATLYEIRSRSGLSRLYAAARDGNAWKPNLPPVRWSASECTSRAGIP